MKIKLLSLAVSLALASMPFAASALTSETTVGGNITSNVEVKGMIVNLGAALAATEVETSVGSFHGKTEVGGNIDSNVTVSGLFDEISIVNVAVAAGTSCGKVAVGSFGASTCSPGGGDGIGQQAAGAATTALAGAAAESSLIDLFLGADLGAIAGLFGQ
jgi:hypothetical protein